MPKRNRNMRMSKEEMKMWKGDWKEHKCGPWCWHHGNGSGGWIYCLGILGAAIYYLQTSTGFWQGVLGILKAIVWPAFVVYKLLGL
jgi:hypothetical protein